MSRCKEREGNRHFIFVRVDDNTTQYVSYQSVQTVGIEFFFTKSTIKRMYLKLSLK